MSYRHQLGYTPTAKDLRQMKGGKLLIDVNKKTGSVKVDMDNVLGIKGAMKDIVSAVAGKRDMKGSGTPKPKPKPKKKK